MTDIQIQILMWVDPSVIGSITLCINVDYNTNTEQPQHKYKHKYNTNTTQIQTQIQDKYTKQVQILMRVDPSVMGSITLCICRFFTLIGADRNMWWHTDDRARNIRLMQTQIQNNQNTNANTAQRKFKFKTNTQNKYVMTHWWQCSQYKIDANTLPYKCNHYTNALKILYQFYGKYLFVNV